MLRSIILFTFLFATATAITQAIFGKKDSYLITTVDRTKPITSLTVDDEHNLYVTSPEGSEYCAKIVITRTVAGGPPMTQTLNDFYHPDANKKLTGTQILAKTTITIDDQNTRAGNAVIFVVKKSQDNAPVYDASKGSITIQSDDKWVTSAVTFLNAMPYFTLSRFDIDSVTDIAVFATPYHLATSSGYDALINIGVKEYALNSFVIIIGPIATVTMANIKKSKFKVTSDITNRFNNTFVPGSQFSISSPGYFTKNNEYVYPHFFPNKRLAGHWTSSRDSAVTSNIQVSNGISGFNFKLSSGSGVSSTNAGVNQKDQKTTANDFKLDYNITNSNSRFLIQITSGGNTLASSIAALILSWLTFVLRQ